MDVIVETCKGSTAKFDFNPIKNAIELRKALPVGLAFPYDFGFIPGTEGQDGDPLDAVIISEFETFPGSLMDCRIIGSISAVQTGKDGKKIRNDRFLAIPEISVQYEKIKTAGNLPLTVKKQLQEFFENYNRQEGRSFQVLKWISAREALALLKTALHKRSKPSTLIQLFVPLALSTDKPFPAGHYAKIKKALTGKFGGVSIYEQKPVSGIWTDKKGKTEHDTIAVFEVMADTLEEDYWKKMQRSLEKLFHQKKIMIRSMSIGTL